MNLANLMNIYHHDLIVQIAEYKPGATTCNP